jgi:hypothetical protein
MIIDKKQILGKSNACIFEIIYLVDVQQHGFAPELYHIFECPYLSDKNIELSKAQTEYLAFAYGMDVSFNRLIVIKSINDEHKQILFYNVHDVFFASGIEAAHPQHIFCHKTHFARAGIAAQKTIIGFE